MTNFTNEQLEHDLDLVELLMNVKVVDTKILDVLIGLLETDVFTHLTESEKDTYGVAIYGKEVSLYKVKLHRKGVMVFGMSEDDTDGGPVLLDKLHETLSCMELEDDEEEDYEKEDYYYDEDYEEEEEDVEDYYGLEAELTEEEKRMLDYFNMAMEQHFKSL